MHILKHFSCSKSSVSAINPFSNYWQQGKVLYLLFQFHRKTRWTLLFIEIERKSKFFSFWIGKKSDLKGVFIIEGRKCFVLEN